MCKNKRLQVLVEREREKKKKSEEKEKGLEYIESHSPFQFLCNKNMLVVMEIQPSKASFCQSEGLVDEMID